MGLIGKDVAGQNEAAASEAEARMVILGRGRQVGSKGPVRSE